MKLHLAAAAMAFSGLASTASAQDDPVILVEPEFVKVIELKEGDEERLKREILREVDKRIQRHLEAFKRDLRKMFAEQRGQRGQPQRRGDGERGDRRARAFAPHAPEPPRPPMAPQRPDAPQLKLRYAQRAQEDARERLADAKKRQAELYARLKRRAAEERGGRPNVQRQSQSRDVRIESRDGKAVIRIEVDGKVVEKHIRTDRPQSFDIELPGGGSLRVHVDGHGGVRVGPDARRNYARGPVMPQRGPLGQREHYERQMKRWAEQHGKRFEQFGREMEKWGEQFGKKLEREFGDRPAPRRSRTFRLDREGDLKELRELDPKLRGVFEKLMRELKGADLEGLRDGMKGFRKQLERLLEDLEEETEEHRYERHERPAPRKAKKQRQSRKRSDREESF